MDALIIASANDYMLTNFAASGAVRETFQNYPIPSLNLNGRMVSNLSMLKHCLDGESEDYIEKQHSLLLKKYDPKFLNGIYLSSFLEKYGFSVECINHLDNEFDLFLENLKQNPKVIVLSTTFISGKYSLKKIVDTIRQHDPNVTIIAGGPLIVYSYIISKYYTDHDNPNRNIYKDTYLFMDTIKELDIDLYITDRFGIGTLVRVLKRIKAGKECRDIPNLAYYKGRYIFTENQPEKHSINDFIVPWDTLDEKFLGHTIPLQSSIGCPHHCKFCNFNNFNDSLKMKRMELLEKELQLLNKRRDIVKEIFFTDENFLLNGKMLEEFCQMKINNNIDIQWSSFIRSEVISRENSQLLYDSGAYSFSMGAESGDPKILKLMNKKSVPEKYHDAVALLNEKGISTVSSFIIGFPGETDETLQNTINFINDFPDDSNAINWISVFPFILLPMSPIEKERTAHSLKGALLDWEHSTMNSVQAVETMQKFILALDKPYLPSIEMNKSIEELGLRNKDAAYLLECISAIIKIDFDQSVSEENKTQKRLSVLQLMKDHFSKVKGDRPIHLPV